jgi:hypothetical protein
MSALPLTAEDQVRVDEILDTVVGMAKVELRLMAELLVSKSNAEFFGETEFLLRDAMHRIGARLLDASLEERKKGGTKDRASAVPNVPNAART